MAYGPVDHLPNGFITRTDRNHTAPDMDSYQARPRLAPDGVTRSVPLGLSQKGDASTIRASAVLPNAE